MTKSQELLKEIIHDMQDGVRSKLISTSWKSYEEYAKWRLKAFAETVIDDYDKGLCEMMMKDIIIPPDEVLQKEFINKLFEKEETE